MRARLIPVLFLATLAACAPASSAQPPDASSPGSADARALSVEVSDFMLDPSSLVATGPSITIEVTNAGPTPHNFSVRDGDNNLVAATADLSTGDAETLRFELEPGKYTTFCGLPGHESLGMLGTLVVEGG